MAHRYSKAVLLAVPLILILSRPGRALPILEGISYSSQILGGCSDPLTCVLDSTNATAHLNAEETNRYALAFGLNVNADAGPFGTAVEVGAAKYTVDFTVTAVNYEVTITARRVGVLRRSADDPSCGGTVTLMEMAAPTLVLNGGAASISLKDVVFPEQSIADGGSTVDQGVSGEQSATVRYGNIPAPSHLSLSFVMSAVAVSSSCEVSARLGAPNGGTSGCSACDYPGDGNRDIGADGLFVEITAVDLDACGDGVVEPPEQCDLGKISNGDPSNCCDATCKYRSNGSSCTDGLFCNGDESCTDGVCAASVGDPCSGLGSCAVCDEANNLCDTSACATTPTPTPTAPAAGTGTPTPTTASAPTGGLPLQPTRELLIGEVFDGDGVRFDTSAAGRVRGTLDLDANGDLRFTAADLARLPRCEADALLIGGVCIDKDEASVWSNPPGSASMGTQYGLSDADYPCAGDGQDCHQQIYARSLAGVTPSAYITWLQAQQACANTGKRLPTNAEWQRAAAGTPDTGGSDNGTTDCATDDGGVQSTGSRSGCVSKWGTYDMVGNVWELVADWMPVSTVCPGWQLGSDDDMCLSGASLVANYPGALIRGGAAGFGAAAGPLAVRADFAGPGNYAGAIGFRCARAPR